MVSGAFAWSIVAVSRLALALVPVGSILPHSGS
jgi:hypothetical protein